MRLNRSNGGFLVIILLAFVGYLLMTMPPKVMTQYARATEQSIYWGYLYLASLVSGGLLLAGLVVWTMWRLWKNAQNKKQRHCRQGRSPSQLSRQEQKQEIEENLATVAQCADEVGMEGDLQRQIRADISALKEKQVNQKLELVAFGTISSGKSSLLNILAGREIFKSEVVGGTTRLCSEIPWPGRDRVMLVDTPGLAEVNGGRRSSEAADAAKNADVVLFVVDGPLRAYEITLLRLLGEMEKRIVICLNKEDWFGQQERKELAAQITRQITPLVMAEDVVFVQAKPATRIRVRVLSDGAETPELVEKPPDLSQLGMRMLEIVERDGRDLLLANLLLRSRALANQSKTQVLTTLDYRAQEIVYQTMWTAGGTAAVNPIPLLDLAGGSALAVKMVLDLARVYRQDVDADTVVTLLSQLSKNLITMLGVSATTPIITSVLASLLKTVPGVGTIAGGIIQGIVQALIIRWIGAVFSQYFRDEMRKPAGGLVELARLKWEEVTQVEELRKLVKMGRKKLRESEI